MKYRGQWDFIEMYNLPIKIREWFYHRLVKQIEDENEAIEKAKKK